MKTKACNKCEEEKVLTEFYKDRSRKDGHESKCKACKKAYDASPERAKKRLEAWSKWYWRDPEARRQRDRERYHADLEGSREKARRNENRRREDPTYRLMKNASRLIRHYITTAKDGSSWDFLSYSPEELKEHIEKQFEPWMNWDNYGNKYGQWNIDHIYPQSKLPYDSLEHPNFQKCWALENLRPLCARENKIKQDKVFTEDEYSVTLNG